MRRFDLGQDVACLDSDVVSRFWQKVDLPGSSPETADRSKCWIWKASGNGKPGYGIFRGGAEFDARRSRRWVLAHRYAYIALREAIPKGMQIDHLCKNRRCVNPYHMEVVTHRVNTLRSSGPSALQSRRDHCIKGHPFDTISAGKRRCSICDREKERRRYIRRYGREPVPQKNPRRSKTGDVAT